MKKSILLILVCISIPSIQATVLIPGNANTVLGTTNPNANTLSFPQPIAVKVFDQFTGYLYLALGTGGSTSSVTPTTLGPSGAFALSFVQRAPVPQYYNAPTFEGFAPTALQSGAFDFMALSTSQGNFYPVIGAVITTSPGTLNQTTMYILNNGQQPVNSSTALTQIIQQSAPILAANPVFGAPGNATAGIAGLAANAQYYFVATFTNADVGFGYNDSGIAVIGYDPTSLIPEQLAAVPGDSAVKSVIVDGTIPQVTTQGTPSITSNRVALFWDNQLGRLYTGLQIATAASGMGNIGDEAKSIVVGQQQSNENGELTLYSFMPDAAIPDGNQTLIAGVKQATPGAPLTVTAAQIKSMHTSTGASYLIVNGGNGVMTTDPTNPVLTSSATGNNIYAMPLVDVSNPDNNTQGLLANKTMFNSATHQFQTPASSTASLTTINDAFALVGGGPLPTLASTPVSGIGGGNIPTSGAGLPINTLDIEVVGDTVYVAMGRQQSDVDDTGVFYSQAMFDSSGKINAWTPWTKRAFPFNGFTNDPEIPDTTRFVAVDPVTALVYAVDNFLAQTLRATNWTQGQFADPLPMAVSAALPRGCFSVLDLDQGTTDFASSTTCRYALFGGVNTVAFAFISQTRDSSPSGINASQKLVTNYQNGAQFNTANFISTSLPLNTSAVKALEYSRRTFSQGATNYFFAAGTNGLNVFADQFGNGFNVNTLNTLNQPPFSTGIWQLAPNIAGSVVDVKTTGKKLYVITQQISSQPPTYQLLSIPFTTNMSTMFAPGNISVIAQSSTLAIGSDLTTAKVFYGMQIIASNLSGSIEQIALATNNGLYVSQAGTGVQAITTQTGATWAKLNPNAQSNLFTGIAGIDTQIPTTVWPISTQDPTGQGIYNRSSLNQLSGSATSLFSYAPTPFDPNSNNPAFATLPLTRYFFSDGAVNLAITNNPLSTPQGPANAITAIPNNLSAWNLPTGALLTARTLPHNTQFYWLKRIGVTGLLMAGTNTGALALE